jgi:hypothetical protein
MLYHNEIPMPVKLPAWIPAAAARPVLFVALLVGAAWVTFSVLRWLWSRWVRLEQEAVVAGREPGDGD